MPSSNEAQVTSAAEWKAAKKQEGEVIELPSGKFMRVKRTMTMLVMLKAGQLPNPLASIVQEMMNKGGNIDPSAFGGKSLEAVQQMLDLADQAVLKAAVEPRVQMKPEDWDEKHPGEDWEPDEDAISLEDVDQDDRMYIFSYAQGAAADLTSFREGQNAFMAQLSNGEGVQNDASESSGG